MKCTHILLSISLAQRQQQQWQAERHYHHPKNICMRVEKLWYTSSSSLLMPDNLASLYRWFDIKKNVELLSFHASFNLSFLCDVPYYQIITQLNLPRGQICCIFSYFSFACCINMTSIDVNHIIQRLSSRSIKSPPSSSSRWWEKCMCKHFQVALFSQ